LRLFLSQRKDRLWDRLEPLSPDELTADVRQAVATLLYLSQCTIYASQTLDVADDEIAIHLEHRQSLRVVLVFSRAIAFGFDVGFVRLVCVCCCQERRAQFGQVLTLFSMKGTSNLDTLALITAPAW
jgi:hypothetical protein